MKRRKSFRYKNEFLVILLAAAIYLPGLSRGGLWDPWETHYAEVARQILVRGDWLTLHWAKNQNRCKWTKQGEVFYSKPPLPFWVMALSFLAFGVNDFAARLPFVLAGAFGLAFLMFVVRTLWDTKRAWLTTLVLASSPMYALLSRQAMTDMMFEAFLIASMGSFMLWAFGPVKKARWLYGFYLFSALAVMSKGLPGVLLPLATVGMYVVVTRKWETLARMRPITGPALFFLVAGPWHMYMLLGGDGVRWYREYILFHHFTRSATVLQGAGSGGLGYYIDVLWSAFFPWFAFLPAALAFLLVGARKKRPVDAGRDTFLPGLFHAFVPLVEQDSSWPRPGKEHYSTDRSIQIQVFAVCWIIVWYAVITWSRTKFNHYVFPLLPPMALLVSIYLFELPQRLQSKGERALTFLGLVLIVLAGREILPSPSVWAYSITYDYTRQPLDRLATISNLGYWLPIFLVVSGIGAAVIAMLRPIRLGIALVVSAGMGLAVWLGFFYVPFVAPAMGQEEAWRSFQEARKPSDRIYNYRMIWRGEMWYSRDSASCVRNRSELKRVLQKPGRIFFITNRDGNKHNQLKREYRSLTGRSLKVVNKETENYIMYLHDGPALKPEPIKPLAGTILKNPPKGIVEVHAHLGNKKVELIGYKLNTTPLEKGTYMDLSLYWSVLGKMNRDMKVFIHMDKPGKRCFVSDTTPVKGSYPTTEWKKGELILDRHSFRVPDDCRSADVSLYVGLFDDKGRLEIKEKELTDSRNRILLDTLDLE
ncbi:MAG: glycosyltransferase family 39 protein [Deltaproteobacteria bacterium]|nr:glycosyltransferase family 39 protein [Deltaproteobacteria bacterium]